MCALGAPQASIISNCQKGIPIKMGFSHLFPIPGLLTAVCFTRRNLHPCRITYTPTQLTKPSRDEMSTDWSSTSREQTVTRSTSVACVSCIPLMDMYIFKECWKLSSFTTSNKTFNKRSGHLSEVPYKVKRSYRLHLQLNLVMEKQLVKTGNSYQA